MENPLEMPIPSAMLKRTEDFARDLAYGASVGKWSTKFNASPAGIGATGTDWETETEHIGGEVDPFGTYKANKWDNKLPSPYLMVTFGYLQVYERKNHGTDYLLTPKAFDLLEKPPITPSVFISYKREYSSSFALLVEAKLKLRDSGIGIFVDKLIKPGDDWEENIREKIKESRYFICLLAPDTYTGSEWVRKELEWAYEASCEIISVFHDSAALNDRYPVWLGKKQIITVDFETAKHYESALDEILVGLGYSTY